MKLAVVVQRYGADISGGAELHARYVAERLARHAQVEVLTTRARDYITWRNELPGGNETINGVLVRRFPVSRRRRPVEFAQHSRFVFEHPHSLHHELRWLTCEGPTSPSLLRHIARTRDDFDFFIFFSFRYFHAYHGIGLVPSKAVLVPTAERDPVVGMGIFPPMIRRARALMYNTPEERALLEAMSHRRGPGVVVGIGSDIPERTSPDRFRKAHNLMRAYAIYVGRIDINKGCRELFDYFQQYAARVPNGLDLVLIGSKHLEIPEHPRIRHLGFVSDEVKFDALAAADVLVMPSPYESLSMVTLEAWALGKPALVNGACDVLRGQCIRSGGGLYYENVDEFCEGLFRLEGSGPMGAALGRHGREYYHRHYAWPVIEQKYLNMLERLSREPSPANEEPAPDFFARRRRTRPPARDVLATLPSGPVVR